MLARKKMECNDLVRLLCLLGTVLISNSSLAYEIETHNEFSQKSAACSVLGTDGFMEGIGLSSIESKKMLFYRELKGVDDDYTLQGIIGWGAKFEDEAPGKRPLNHFFDPLDNSAIGLCL